MEFASNSICEQQFLLPNIGNEQQNSDLKVNKKVYLCTIQQKMEDSDI
jgi:hypothetical protein